MDEAGDPNGLKYGKYQAAITQFFNITPIPVTRTPKLKLPSVQMNPVGYLFSETGRTHLGRDHFDGTSTKISSQRPVSFEVMNQFSGFVLYETDMPTLELDPTEIVVNNLHDRALVYIDQEYVGSLSRGNNIYSLSVHPGLGNKLQILVENQGRINYAIADEFKVIFYCNTNECRKILIHKIFVGNTWLCNNFPKEWSSTGINRLDYDRLSAH